MRVCLRCMVAFLLLSAAVVKAQTPAASGPAFDVDAATNAWLAQVPAAKRARSDAYFEGGYWLILWDFAWTAAISYLLLSTRWSAQMRSLAERLTRFRALQTFVYWAQYIVVTTVLTFPWVVYESFYREHRYGLATQTFGPWFGDQMKQFGLTLVLGGIAVIALFAIVRGLPRTWHVWGVLASMVFLILGSLIAPVFILPLFNKYTPLTDASIRNPILSLARANGIPAANVYEVDASRQSTRISANVSGLFGTERISLNDNLLNRCTPAEILSVVGHEMGHYVLNHVYKDLLVSLVILTILFAGGRSALERSLRRWGSRWGIRGVSDVAVLPLAVLIVAIFGFIYTPIGNTVTRAAEQEADMYGLNAVRQPDAFAEVALKLADYRKLSPGPLEEWIFFDHPAGRTRIHSAMRWKAENVR